MRQMPAGNLIVGLELCWQGIPAFPQHPGFFFINRMQEPCQRTRHRAAALKSFPFALAGRPLPSDHVISLR
jgi:hypothetical protein